MITVCDSLLSISAYPIPLRTILSVCTKRGIVLETPLDDETTASPSYRLAEADLMMWLSTAPNVSQGGQSYSFTAEERNQFRRRAGVIYGEIGSADDKGRIIRYGYKGPRL